MDLRTDVVVVGAGAAGLAAARALSQGGANAVVLEARERIGGRILTREDAGLLVPAELGAEFVHGTAEVSFALLRAANTVAVDTVEGAFMFEDGALRPAGDPFATLSRVMAGARALTADLSVAAFLAALPEGPGVERDRRLARMLVEGFDAADPARAGTLAIAQEWDGGEDGQTARQFRPLGGYAPLLRTLHAGLDPARVDLRLGTPVHALRRHAGGVEVHATTAHGSPLHVGARAAIVTLPLGVLQSADVRFEPPLPERTGEALRQLVMGPVVKLVLRFRTAWWERLHGERYRSAAFFQNADARFPTFWTQLPLRAPQLVAWAGGPKADALAELDHDARVAVALTDLRTLFGGAVEPEAELDGAYGHDWQRDVYARGAYSYVATGGGDARGAIAAPLDGVLFFAGEATAPVAEAGTVAGALGSGERAAAEALRALGAN